jgi:predicted dehydrogenase
MPVRFGVIGGGIWGNYHMLAAKQLEREGRVELVAIAARTEQTASKMSQKFGIKGYTDYKLMIQKEKLDGVSIVTPDHLHREITLFALENDLHVLVEKPMDLTTTGCRQMVDCAKRKMRLLQVDFHKRYDPYNIDMMRKVQEGKIGNIYYIYAYMEDKIIVPTQWIPDWAPKSTPFWFIGVHKFDLIRWVTGLEAVSVTAHGYRGKLTSLGIKTYDAISASIELQNGIKCNIDVNWILPERFEAVVNQGIRIVGSEGIIELDSQDRGLRYSFSADGIITPNMGAFFSEESVLGGHTVRGYFVDPVKDFLINVSYLKKGGDIDSLENKIPSGMDGLKATQCAEAVEKSILENRKVLIAELEY